MGVVEYKKVSKAIVSRIKEMAKTRYDSNIYNKYYRNLKLDGKTVLLGEDWYLIYSIEDNVLSIHDWLSLNNGNDIKRMYEMRKTITNLVINHKGIIKCTFRHNTSYKLYKRLKDKGYVNTIDEYLFLDRNIDESIQNKIDSEIPYESPDNLKKLLIGDEYKEYYPYFLYETTSTLTDKAIKKCKI